MGTHTSPLEFTDWNKKLILMNMNAASNSGGQRGLYDPDDYHE